MNIFIRWFTNTLHACWVDFLGEIIAIVIFVTAGLAWIYFSSIYAAIAVVIIGIVLGGYGWKRGHHMHKNQK